MAMTLRTKTALRNFASGMNCAQSVFLAYSDLLGLDSHTAALISQGFGGGIGRLRDNCGTFSAAIMLCGYMVGNDGGDKSRRGDVYSVVQKVHARFIEEFGTVNCAQLLNKPCKPENPAPDDRNPSYYASRPCAKIIRKACGIIEEFLPSERKESK